MCLHVFALVCVCVCVIRAQHIDNTDGFDDSDKHMRGFVPRKHSSNFVVRLAAATLSAVDICTTLLQRFGDIVTLGQRVYLEKVQVCPVCVSCVCVCCHVCPVCVGVSMCVCGVCVLPCVSSVCTSIRVYVCVSCVCVNDYSCVCTTIRVCVCPVCV